MENLKKIILYTDGSCIGNPGPGGYAYILIYGQLKKEFCGYEPSTTNNRMELTAVIKGLNQIKEPCDVTIYTDSAYVLNAFEQDWITNWQLKGWRTANKKEVLNKDLWLQLLDAMQRHKVSWVKVKGHADNEFNNRCDELARGETERHINNQEG